jgi:RNA polymerase primary sigma factor
VKRVPSTGHERVLARRIEAGDEQARHTLIEQHLGLVESIARRYARSGVPLSDLLQEGTLGLIQAVDGFDWRKGVPFGAYAALWIRQAIQRAVPALRYSVRIPADALRSIVTLHYLTDRLSQEYHRQPTLQEIRNNLPPSALGIEELQQMPFEPLPLDPSTGDAHEAGAERSSSESVADQDGLSPEESLLASETEEHLRHLLHHLGAREQDILVRRLGLFGEPEQTFAEIAADLGLSRQRIKQIEQRALVRLRDLIHEGTHAGYLFAIEPMAAAG